MRFATDTGGTFTDLVVEDDTGRLHLFKAATVPADPVRGVLDAFGVAAAAFGLERAALLARGSAFIHGTTHAINAIVTRRTARTALLVTAGHPDILTLREGGRIEPFNHAVPYPDAYVPRALTFEVPERVMASGAVRQALDEAAVEALLERLVEARVEAVAVSLLWAGVNPAHEQAVGRLIERRLPGVPYTLSHALNPSIREYRRTIATAIDASLKPLMNRYLGGLTASLREAGYTGPVFVLSSQGGMVSADEVQRTPILAINSGPSMAPIAGALIAAAETRLPDCIVFDTGGTTFDVSLVRDGRVPMTQETWLGRPYQSDLTGFPSVDVRSIGAGGGSIAWVDSGGVLHVGPQSAGAVPGPAAYGAGGERATVTDAAVVLGYIDPGYFLGGRIALDRARAEAAIDRDVAAPMGVTRERAARAVFDVWTENMVQAIADITVNQGIDPRRALLLAGGGAGGLNAAAIAARLGCPELVVPEVGAALSAAGAAVSAVVRDFRQVFVTRTDGFDAAGAAAVLDALAARADAFADEAGLPAAGRERSLVVEARYPHQVWEIDVPVPLDACRTETVGTAIAARFHDTHDRIFAFRDPDSAVEIIAWRLSVSGRTSAAPALRLADDSGSAAQRTRRAWFGEAGWLEVPVHAFGAISGELAGPAIVESPFTSVVLEPGTRFTRSAAGNLVVHATPRGAAEGRP